MSNLERATIEVARRLPSGAVLTDRTSRESYCRDESEAEPVVPCAVVIARTTREVADVMQLAYEHEVPVTPRAGATGRTGGAVPRRAGWVLALEGFGGIDEVSGEDAISVVRPGTTLAEVHAAVEREGWFYPPDPNSVATCTIGGNIAENAGGPRGFKYGMTGDYVLGVEAVLADGTVVQLGKRTKKGVTGYDLTSLVVGSEGTLAIVTRATLRLVPAPERVATLLAWFDDEGDVAPAITACLRAGVTPRCLELLDAVTLDAMRDAVRVPDTARAMLLVEVDGDVKRAGVQAQMLGSVLEGARAFPVEVADDRAQRDELWAARREMSRTLRARARNKLSEDVVAPRSKIGELLRRVRGISERSRIVMPTYGHAGDGNLHVNFLWNTPDEKPRVDAAIAELFENVIALRGTLSGEHGIGVLKAPFLSLEQSPELIALQRRIKAQFDRKGILNPGKIFSDAKFHGPC